MSKKIVDENGNTYVQKKPFYKRVWFWLLAIVLIAIIGGALGGKTSSKEVVKTTPEKIVDNYKNNTSTQADKTYKDKITQVTGKVSDVKAGVVSGQDVTIDAGHVEGNEFEKQTITFNFSNSNKKEAESIKKDSTVTIKGEFSNASLLGGDNGEPKWVSNVTFTQSSLVK